MNYFSDKIAIVTGGGSGIGKSICVYLHQKNSKIIIVDWNLEAAEQVKELIEEQGGYAEAKKIDVSNFEEMEQLVQEVQSTHGRIDLLFNNAGVSVNGEFEDITIESWQRIFKVNVWGVIFGTKLVYPIMRKQGFGQIVNTASLAGLIPGGLTTCYSASKHAVVGFSQTLRSEAKQYSIKINTLCPGYIRTNIQETTPNVTAYLNAEKNIQMNQNMKFKTPEDCINQIMRGIRKNRSIIISPTQHKLYWYLYRIFPAFIPFMFDKIIHRMKKNALES